MPELNVEIMRIENALIRRILSRISGHIGAITKRQHAMDRRLAALETGQSDLIQPSVVVDPTPRPAPEPFDLLVYFPNATYRGVKYGQAAKSAVLGVRYSGPRFDEWYAECGGLDGFNGRKFWGSKMHSIKRQPVAGGRWIVCGEMHHTANRGWSVSPSRMTFSRPAASDDELERTRGGSPSTNAARAWASSVLLRAQASDG